MSQIRGGMGSVAEGRAADRISGTGSLYPVPKIWFGTGSGATPVPVPVSEKNCQHSTISISVKGASRIRVQSVNFQPQINRSPPLLFGKL